MRRAAPLLALLLLAAPAPALGQERPSDEELFGGPTATPTPAPAPAQPQAPAPTAPPTAPPAPGGDPRADELLGGRSSPAEGLWDQAKEDPLKVGGLLYLRTTASWYRGTPPSAWPLSSPNLLDVYLDARPNDRVRAFALGRLFYTPTGSGAAPLGPFSAPPPPESRAVLDQAYLNFDLDHAVFVTAGKQHVKWGTGRFWNPTDYLHPVRRDPLAPYDDRSGVTMVKAHLPWERRGWNLYGVAVLEDLAGGSTAAAPAAGTNRVGTLGRVGLGGRAEIVLGPVELAADAVAQRGHRPRFGLDGSLPLGDVDLHFEVALRNGVDAPRYQAIPGAPADGQVWQRYGLAAPRGVAPAAVLGGEWSWKYSDEDNLTVGAEYAWDRAGYDSAQIYPLLLVAPYLPGAPDQRAAFTPFNLARQYAGAYLLLPKPGRWNDTTFTLSVLGSLSDGSAVVRLDHSVLLNTYLTLETYLAGHLGRQGGEFRFGGTFPPQRYGPGPGEVTPAVQVAPPVLDAGVALRVSL